MRILVTGGTGAIGSHVVCPLQQANTSTGGPTDPRLYNLGNGQAWAWYQRRFQ
jgi:nucleoside-diphosphate-sugar epimerase